MLSYQHIYHAGAPADVVKHTVLAALLARLTGKEKPLTYYETHAGRGLYPVAAAEMQKTAEWRQGLAKVWPRRGMADVPPAAARYLEAVAHYNRGIGLTQVPGSPALAQHLLRAGDKLVCCEAHPAEALALKDVLQGDKRADLYEGNGHVVIPTLLPPAGARGLIHIDPSYEVKDEYATTLNTVADIYGIWSKGVAAVWYPLLAADLHRPLAEGLQALKIPATWQAEVRWPGQNLVGTGLVVLRLPYRLENELILALAWLADAFGGTAAGRWLNPPV
jgi:23S rRNA (adenine2030-N6)-methyltransferase